MEHLAHSTNETQIIELIAYSAEIVTAKIMSSSRLLDDLGIDGDDAAELFASIHDRFGTDLTLLYANWDRHFGPEGIPPETGMIFVLAAFVGGLISAPFGALVGFAVGAV